MIMLKLLLRFFPPIVVGSLAYISFLVLHVLERKRVISYEAVDKLVPSIAMVSLFLLATRDYIGKLKIYEKITPSKMYINVWKVILCLITVVYVLLSFIGKK
jgi:hypothetical protein